MTNNFSLGIDFGTNYCRAAIFINGKPKIITTRYSKKVLPLIFEIHQIKSDTLRLPDTHKLSFINIKGLKQKIGIDELISINHTLKPIVEVLANIFKLIKNDIEEQLDNLRIKNVIISIPATFTESQRAIIKSSAEMAGFQNINLLNDSTAVLMAQEIETSKNILIYSLGAGFFNCSLIKVGNKRLQELWHENDIKISGNHFDSKILNYLINTFKIELKQIAQNAAHRFSLRNYVEKLKIALSTQEKVQLDLNSILLPNLKYNKTEILTFNRTEFENFILNDIEQTMNLIKQSLQKAQLYAKNIDSILLIGGSTKIPLVYKKLKTIFDSSITFIDENQLAKGAAIYGSTLKINNKIQTKDKTTPKIPNNNTISAPAKLNSTQIQSSWAKLFNEQFYQAEINWSNKKFDEAFSVFNELHKEIDKFISHLCHQEAKKSSNHESINKFFELGFKFNPNNLQLINDYYSYCLKSYFLSRNDNELHKAKLFIIKAIKLKPNEKSLRELYAQIEKEIKSASNTHQVKKKKKRKRSKKKNAKR